MVFLQERIGRIIQELNMLIYPEKREVKNYKMLKTSEDFTDVSAINTDSWQDFKEIWGGHREYYWFSTCFEVPEEFDGKCLEFEILTGRESEWDATNPQFTIYVNGKRVQGLDTNHKSIILTDKAVKDTKYDIILSAFTGESNFSLQLKSTVKVLDKLTEKYYYDISVPFNTAVLLGKEEKAYIDIILKINESINLIDLRKPFSKEYYQSLDKAQTYFIKEFYEKYCGNSEAVVYCVGHTHIDVAWLWTLSVTKDKAVRSFSTVLELMKRYPEYLFMSSQPQLYKYVKEKAPDIYEGIKERVKEGRWETDGAMFVEADCNIASGEALVRQILIGKRFFKSEFDKDNRILWLPDVFGYSAALPQILQKSGVPYFMTTKISWNEFNKLPYDTFEWEGIDGTKVLTHFIPARDYNTPAGSGADSFKTSHFTTYNGEITATQIKGSWQRYQQKHINNEVLMSFGYGDGGGGPTKEMLETQRRLEKGIPGVPKTKMATANEFFDKLAESKGSKYFPTWTGELYLEYHRGTYTSMARNKKYNRKSEFAFENVEAFSIMDMKLNGVDYPAEKINDAWEIILLNQFHDILPGSSIKEVYDDSKEQYEEILSQGKELIEKSLNNITSKIEAPENSVVVYNPNGMTLCDVVEFDIPEKIKSPAVYDGDEKLPVQITVDGKITFKAKNIPSKGYRTFALKEDNTKCPSDIIVTKAFMSNKYFDIKFNEKGQFVSVYDKCAKRELLKGTANVIMSYEDKPHNYDAWDINNYYNEKSWEVDDVSEIEAVEVGAVRGTLKVSRKYLDSTVTQYITIYSDVARIDVKNEIDWKESQILLKVLFPVDIHGSCATFDIQYGNVIRPTHYNTMWDFARFEVCAHKWIDLSEDGYGVSLLNDCKYGFNVHDGIIGMSMLKSAILPNKEADKEKHEFIFSIYPHVGGWKDAGTVAQAYSVNNPLIAKIKDNCGGTLSSEYSAVKTDKENVIIEVMKKAEDSNDTVIRVYECYNRRTNVELTFANDIKDIKESDLLENEIGNVEFISNKASFTIKPYEIKTFILKW